MLLNEADAEAFVPVITLSKLPIKLKLP